MRKLRFLRLFCRRCLSVLQMYGWVLQLKQEERGKGSVETMERVYLDNAATCLVQPRVLEKASEFVNMLRDTALSTGDVTRMQRSSLKTAREAVAGFLGCKAGEIALMQSTSNALGTLVCCLPLHRCTGVGGRSNCWQCFRELGQASLTSPIFCSNWLLCNDCSLFLPQSHPHQRRCWPKRIVSFRLNSNRTKYITNSKNSLGILKYRGFIFDFWFEPMIQVHRLYNRFEPMYYSCCPSSTNCRRRNSQIFAISQKLL